MTFYKIIQKKKVVNVGCVFLKWNANKQKLFLCDADDAEFVQSFDQSKIYTASWLKPAPKAAGKYESAEVVVIDEVEFDELLHLLNDGETVEEEQPVEPVLEVHEEPEVPEEKPMTIAEMRELILRQQEQIETLLQKFQE